MKKIISFSVLLALLSAAVFAQEGSGWKIGFTAQLARNFFYSTKAFGEYERSATGQPTQTGKLGDYIDGSSNLFTWTSEHPWTGARPDNRLLISISNSGEHHSVYLDFKVDDTWIQEGAKFSDLLNGDAADWWFSGDTGGIEGAVVVFDGKVGTGRYNGFVPVYELWDDWIQAGDYNFFGVQRTDRFQQSNNISAVGMDGDPWQAVYALGATFGGNFRFALGSTLGSFNDGLDNPYASASSVEAGFMLSAKGLGPLSLDAFYAINGNDRNTFVRGTGAWGNLFGVYAGLNIVENLGLSVGYTGNFLQNEKQEEPDGTTTKPFDLINPLWSGIDIKVKFTGINKLSLTFNNNISFAAVKAGDEITKTGTNVIIGLDGNDFHLSGDLKDANQSWFAYNAVLGANYALSDRLSVTFALMNLLGVYSSDSKREGTGYSTTAKSTITKDELRSSIHAEYTVGNVTVGLGLNLGLITDSYESQRDAANSGTSSTETTKITFTTVKFGVPLFFKVAF